MSIFNKKKEQCVGPCPILDNLVKVVSEEVRKNFYASLIPIRDGRDGNLSCRIDIIERSVKDIGYRLGKVSHDIERLNRDSEQVRDVVKNELLGNRPSAYSFLVLSVHQTEQRERELRALICRQNRYIENLESRVEKLEKRKDVNINIINKTTDTTVIEDFIERNKVGENNAK